MTAQRFVPWSVNLICLLLAVGCATKEFAVEPISGAQKITFAKGTEFMEGFKAGDSVSLRVFSSDDEVLGTYDAVVQQEANTLSLVVPNGKIDLQRASGLAITRLTPSAQACSPESCYGCVRQYLGCLKQARGYRGICYCRD